MNLDDRDALKAIDKQNVLGRIDAFPNQFESAWNHSQTLPLPKNLNKVKQVIITGMGGSAIGGDLIAALAAYGSPVSFNVVRGYELPTWVTGQETLVIASSFSGNTEETLTIYDEALQRNVQILSITTGGKLQAKTEHDGHTLWTFEDAGPPRAAVGWSFGLLLGLAVRAGWLPQVGTQVEESLAALRSQQQGYLMDVPAIQNPAKQLASKLIGQIPTVVGSGIFEAVARRWKCQFNENSDVFANYETLPEMNHNAVVGVDQPHDLLMRQTLIFITSSEFDHSRVGLRHQLTADLFLHHNTHVEKFIPKGESRLAQMLHAILFGDYVSYYLAIAYQIDPMVIVPIDDLKSALASRN